MKFPDISPNLINMKMANKNNNLNENIEYGVDSRYLSDEERKSESVALMQARLERMSI